MVPSILYALTPESVKIAPIWRKLANKMKGIIKVAAIDCEANPKVTEAYGIYQYPTIKLLSKDRVETYTSDNFNLKTLAEFATRRLVSHVHNIGRSSEIETFLKHCSQSRNKKCILLFTTTESTSPLLKSLSTEFEKSIVIGETRSRNVAKLFGISSEQLSNPKSRVLFSVDPGKLVKQHIVVNNSKEKCREKIYAMVIEVIEEIKSRVIVIVLHKLDLIVYLFKCTLSESNLENPTADLNQGLHTLYKRF